MKKIISVLMALLMISSFAVLAFAGEDTATDYTQTEWYKAANSTKGSADGQFNFGSESTAYYQVTTGKMYTTNEAKTAVTDPKGNVLPLVDSIYPENIDQEAVTLKAFYVIFCPTCGKAIGGFSLSAMYDGCTATVNNNTLRGVCTNCANELNKEIRKVEIALSNKEITNNEAIAKRNEIAATDISLPDPTTIKVYRYIIVPGAASELHTHFLSFRDTNMANLSGSIFAETESLYGDGKDLPQSFLEFSSDNATTSATLVSAKTSGVNIISAGGIISHITEFISSLISHLRYNTATVAISNFFTELLDSILDFFGSEE